MTQPTYSFDSRLVLQHYMQKRYDKVCQMIIDVLAHFNKVWYSSIAPEDLRRLEDFVSTFLYIFTRSDFKIPANFTPIFANIGHIVANVVAMTSYKTTDGAVEQIVRQENNFYRLLPLLSIYNKLVVDSEKVIALNPQLGSLWWLAYQTPTPGSLTAEVHQRMLDQYNHIPSNFQLSDCRVAPLYFQVSYFAPEQTRIIKSMFNRQISAMQKVEINNVPRRNSIAIITARWQPTTAVYKSIYPQVATLVDKYDLTLVQTGEGSDKIDRGLFKSVKQVKMQPNLKGCDITEIATNDFQVAYFPDIGMNFESVWLSNVRLAPIMVTGYGHPVSTFGSQIDYFIGGAEVERVDLATENYGERLVLIPGLGCYPVDPKYTRKGKQERSEIWINCCWTTHKINYPMLCMLKELQLKSTRPVKFQFFPSWTIGKYNNLIYFVRTLNDFFGEGNWFYRGNLQYQEYLALMEQADFAIDSHPFGGYNTIIDSFFVGCPVVAIEGTQFANRASSALLRRVGLDNLVSRSIENCHDIALGLINNPATLGLYRHKLADVDKLQRLLLNTDEPKYFTQAIDYLIENHNQLQQSREPIIIGS
jgi:hypothetical protein